MTNEELKQWLRENSSGIYRPSRYAADVIEDLEKENERLRCEISETMQYFREKIEILSKK